MADNVLMQMLAARSQANLPPSSLDAADAAMKLTPQERALYQMHFSNLYGPGGVDHPPSPDNPQGSRSTLYQAVQEHNGKFYSIPTVWGGKIETEKYTDPKTGKVFDVPNQTALANVARMGWENFPAYDTPDAADARYSQLHKFIDQDTANYFKFKRGGFLGLQ
jgi:hypothetical protein